MKLSRALQIILLLIAVVFIMVVTKDYLLPFVIALVLWYFTSIARQSIRRNRFVREKVPKWVQNSLILIIFLSVLVLVAELLTYSIQQLAKNLNTYETNFQAINASIYERFQFDLINAAREYSGNIQLSDVIEPIMNGITGIIGDGFIILIYFGFLLLEEAVMQPKFDRLFTEPSRHAKAKELLGKINKSFSSYILLKTYVSLLTAVLSFIALKIIGVDSPILWAFIIFLLNFIPNIGSLAATAFPVLIAMLQFGDILPGIWVLLSVGAVQLFVGNVIEPRVMGNTLNISPLVVIIALVLWGAIWGPVGMVLSVPITVMLSTIFAQFPETKGIAILLSSNGKVE